MKVKRINVKSILTKTKLPGADYVVNPYIGCTFACSYCYATFMGRFTGHTAETWGEYLDVKMNAAEVLKIQISKLKVQNLGNYPIILFSSVTDPYIGYEAKYEITRKCLEVIVESGINCKVSILTKSPLVTRDIDLLKKLNATVGFTITSTDDKVSRLFEGNAPIASARLDALKKIRKAGIDTYVCINPLLPHFTAQEKSLRKLFDVIWKTGNREIWLEHLNLSWNKLDRIREVLKNKAPQFIKYFEKAKSEDYKRQVNELVFEILKEYNFSIGGGGIFDHKRKTIIQNEKLSRKNRKIDGWKVEKVQ